MKWKNSYAITIVEVLSSVVMKLSLRAVGAHLKGSDDKTKDLDSGAVVFFSKARAVS